VLSNVDWLAASLIDVPTFHTSIRMSNVEHGDRLRSCSIHWLWLIFPAYAQNRSCGLAALLWVCLWHLCLHICSRHGIDLNFTIPAGYCHVKLAWSHLFELDVGNRICELMRDLAFILLQNVVWHSLLLPAKSSRGLLLHLKTAAKPTR